jgi:diguanylate cyclase (GGDEF)-like protein
MEQMMNWQRYRRTQWHRMQLKHYVVAATWPAICVALIALTWNLLRAYVSDARADMEEINTTKVAAVAESYSHQVASLVDQIDKITLNVKYYWETSPASIDLEEQAARGLYSSLAPLSVSIIDRRGKIIQSTYDADPALNFGQTDYFLQHRDRDDLELLISEPRIGKQFDREVIHFSRRVNTNNGTFDGIVLIAIDPRFFTTIYNKLNLGDAGLLSIRKNDGTALVEKIGSLHDLMIPVLSTDFAPLQSQGLTITLGSDFLDREVRLVNWKMLDRYPLTTFIGISNRELLGTFENRVSRYYEIAWVFTAFVLVIAVSGYLLLTHLKWRKNQAEETRNTYQMAVDAANEGFYMVKAIHNLQGELEDFQIEDCNEKGAQLLQESKGKLIGRKLSEINPEKSAKRLLAIFRNAMATGFFEDEVRLKSVERGNVTWLYRRIVRAGTGLAITVRDISQVKEHERALSDLANTDALTTLPNRHWLMEYLPVALTRARSSASKLAVLFVDLDNFKKINDTLGHFAGDNLLKSVALRIQASLRHEDHVVRLGGDEFTVILEQIDEIEDVHRVIESIFQNFQEPFPLPPAGDFIVSASIGVSIFPQDGDDDATLIKHADTAMYAAKTTGKGRFRLYQPNYSEGLLTTLNLEQDMHLAIERDEFVLYYQPRVDTFTGKLSSMEALVRWQHPVHGLVFPAAFIDVAESSGQILEIGKIIIEKVVSQIAQWHEAGLAIVPVSINVSALQFNRGDLEPLFASCIERYKVDPSFVELEITESTMMSQVESIAGQLTTLRDLGIKLLLDDFGTGYSSLSQLQKYDFDVLKVDRSFTSALTDKKEGKIFFKAIVSMAHALHIDVVAEGVESRDQLKALQELECNEIQGFLISEPVPAAKIPSLLQEMYLFPKNLMLEAVSSHWR